MKWLGTIHVKSLHDIILGIVLVHCVALDLLIGLVWVVA